jgi:DNA-binding Lrp family transcriptional regulator
MRMVAGVLIRTVPQQSNEVYWTLKNMEGVATIIRVFGRYDLVLMIRALDLDAAGKLMDKIRAVEGIASTETLIAAPPPEPQRERGPV